MMYLKSPYLVIIGMYFTMAKKTGQNHTRTYCPFLKHYPNDLILYSLDKSPNALGSTIYFACKNKHMMLFGQKEMKCKRRGWSTKRFPRCKARKCPDPGKPEFGRRYGNNFTIGATVFFYCQSGLQLFGSRKRVCQITGKWSGHLTTCYDNNSHCPDPGIPINARKTGRNYNRGDVVKYSCKRGYKLVQGSLMRTCQKNGKWSGLEPTCEGNTIPPISVVSNQLQKTFVKRLMKKTCSSKTANCGKRSNDSRLRGFRSRYRDGLDLMFVLDSSSSITNVNFRLGLELVKEMVRRFGIDLSDDGTAIACVSFGTKPKLEFNFQDHSVSSTVNAIERIARIKYVGGATDSRRALDMVLNDVLAMARNHSKKAVMFITDGKSNLGRPAAPAARKLKSRGVEIYVIGIGSFVEKEELREIASPPYNEHVFRIEHYMDIESLIDTITDYSECGRVQRRTSRIRIVGGQKSTPGKWPWTVLVNGTEGFCGGTLLNRRWVLTAAHCIVPNSAIELWNSRHSPIYYEVKIGYTDLVKIKAHQITVGVEEMFVHDDYLGFPWLVNDIALIKLQYHVGLQKYSKFIQRICLPDGLNFVEINRTGGVVVGWGSTKHRTLYDRSIPITSNVLKEVFLPFVNDTLCKERTVINGRNLDGWLFNNNTMFCAGRGLAVNDTCQGDSGGPLMIKRYDKDLGIYRWYQIGITSWGVGCANKNEYAYMTKVTAFVDWIRKTMKENTS